MMQCIQVAKKGRNREVDVLRHTIFQQKSTFCVRRLLRDLRELEDCEEPVVGVSARPLEKDMLMWHGNLRGPEGTPYAGGVFHLSLQFPDTYPHAPPKVTLLTPLPEHPNVFGGGTELCLDMLQAGKGGGLYEGWTSGYSVLSILLQLQSFLFERPHDLRRVEGDIRKRVQTANQFVCSHPGCRHKGPIQAWPEFHKREAAMDAFVSIRSDAERLKTDTCCFHSRLRLDETPALGVGVSVARVPRTGEIRSISATMDLLSLKAFMKDGVRASLSKQKFSHWLPVFLGHAPPERALFFAEHALSMLCENSSRKFTPAMVLQVLPKLLVTLAVDFMQEALHTSLAALRVFLYFLRLFALLLARHPEAQADLEARLVAFKADQANRIKERCSSLGDVLAFALVSGQTPLNKVMHEYLDESLDRQVLWMLRDVPELGESGEAAAMVDAKRDEVAFKTNIVSNRVLLFFHHLATRVLPPAAKAPAFYKGLDERFGRLPDAQEEALQQACESIREVKSFETFFSRLGLPQLSRPELTARLRQAVANSLRKKYHGDDDDVNALPEVPEMMAAFAKRLPGSKDFLATEQKPGEPIVWEPADPQHPAYRAAFAAYCPGLPIQASSQEAGAYFEKLTLNPLRVRQAGAEHDGLLATKQLESYGEREPREQATAEWGEDTTWRSLLIQAELERRLSELAYNPDFKALYALLERAAEIRSLVLPAGPKGTLKSGHYWLMVVLTRLPQLRHLTIHTPETNRGGEGLGLEGLKYLAKGLANFRQAGGRLESFSVVRTELGVTQAWAEKFGQALRSVGEDLGRLCLRGLQVTKAVAQAVGRVLSENKRLRALELTQCGLSIAETKEVADGLMRAKQLERIRLAGNPRMDYGVNYVLYNLAFSPKISLIDISDVVVSQRTDETAEALYKLLKISASLETLRVNNTLLVHNLSNDFWKALAENATLRVLELDTPASPARYLSNLSVIGKYIAFNRFRKGALAVLSLRHCVSSYSYLDNFINSMRISERDHEQAFGDPAVAAKMTGTQLVNHFRCGLEECYFAGGNLTSGFNLVQWLKYSAPRPMQPLYRFMTEGCLKRLELANACLRKNDADLLGVALADPACTVTALLLPGNNLRKEGAKSLSKELAVRSETSPLTALNLDSNKLGVSGGRAVASLLAANPANLAFLSLANNALDVDGARSLKAALASNSSLKTLDLSYNRLRKKGLAALAQGLQDNPKSALQALALRNNFLGDDPILSFLATAPKLQALFLRHNPFSELGLTRMATAIKDNQKGSEESKEGVPMLLDVMERLPSLDAERLERTIWVSPVLAHHSAATLKRFFENKKCGIVVDVRVREGAFITGKPLGNRFAFVEFAHPTSVLRALRLASKKKSSIDGARVRIYKAGSRNVTVVKPKKSKDLNKVRVQRFGGNPTMNFRGKRGSRPPFRGGRGGSSRGFRGGRR